MAASRSLTAIATWSISVSSMSMNDLSVREPTEERDLVEMLLARRLVGHTQPFLGREAQYRDLSLDEVVVHLQRGFARLVQWEHLRHRRMDPSLAYETIGLPCFAVVREMAPLQRLEVHPEVAVVVLDLET